MSVRFDDFLNEQLEDPEFRAEYETLQAEHYREQVNKNLASPADHLHNESIREKLF